MIHYSLQQHSVEDYYTHQQITVNVYLTKFFSKTHPRKTSSTVTPKKSMQLS